MTRHHQIFYALMLLCFVGGLISAPAAAYMLQETPALAGKVASGELPTVENRIPETPLIVELDAPGQTIGRHGGSLRTIVGRAKDIRYMVVYGYARLVGYNEKFDLVPDILRAVDVDLDGAAYTFHLRPGHRWSDGHPFTTEDFRYYWEDVANNEALTPAGPPVALLVEGRKPTVTILDPYTVQYRWHKPNPRFLSLLAQPRPPFIYRPAHFLKQFHEDFGDPDQIARFVADANVRNWAQLHNRKDNMYNNDVVDLPTLQPWMNKTEPPSTRFVMPRNPYFHRIDGVGRQLPYIDQLVVTIAENSLIAAKTISGESDLQARGLNFADLTSLKTGEDRNDYTTRLWPIGTGSNFALYPNLNVNDPVWRAVFRDVRVRRALSLGVNRADINKTFFFGLAQAGNNTVLASSPLYRDDYQTRWAAHDPDQANALLDEAGLDQRDQNGVRLLPDGRPMEIIVETAGESAQDTDVLQLVEEAWSELDIKLFIKPSTRQILRNRAYSGAALMTLWSGWNNGTATPDMDPIELVPVAQENLAWPKWGQFHQTKGKSGEKPDLPEGLALLDLYERWEEATSAAERAAAWSQMLEIHADQQFVIGLISAVSQPIVVSNRLRNVPLTGLYSWNPGAHFGLYRPDQFWFAPDEKADAPPQPSEGP